MTLALWLVLAACAIGAYTDVVSRRIPNALCIALCVVGIALHASQGFVPALFSLGFALVILLAGSLVFSLGLIGGGDVKLVAAAAAALGTTGDVLAFLLYTVVCGGIVALVYSLARGRLGSTLSNVRAMSATLVLGAGAQAPASSITMPYALAIFAGAAVLASAHTFAPMLRIPL